jgi:hypothetical protein
MSMADDIIGELDENPGLTVIDITVNIFGRRNPYKQRVNNECHA